MAKSDVVRSRAFQTASTALCAALYALGAYATAYIQSPWGRGQFRPAVFIPAIFALTSGPMSAGLGAAMGTLIADSIKHGQVYIPSLTAAVPGNFLGFYLFGYLLKRRFNWNRFIYASIASLLVGCFTIAFLYVPTLYLLGILPQILTAIDLSVFSLALGIWFFITEYPFQVFLVPPILRALSLAKPSLVGVKLEGLNSKDALKRLMAKAFLIPGLLFLSLGLAFSYTPLCNVIITGLTVRYQAQFAAVVLDVVFWMFIISGLATSMMGILIYLRAPKASRT